MFIGSDYEGSDNEGSGSGSGSEGEGEGEGEEEENGGKFLQLNYQLKR